jgi:pantothenate kinase type III
MLANTTEKAVYQACLLGAVSFIDGVAERTRKQLGPDVALLLTGGYGKLLLPSLSLDYHYIPDLVLHGLAMIASEK